MGVSKVGGRVESRQNVEFCEGGPCRIWRSGGFPKLSRKIFPLKPLFPPFHPFFSSSTLSSNSSSPQTPPSQLFRAGQKSLPYPQSHLFLSFPSLGPYRTLSEHLRNPSLGSPKRPKTALFRPF